MRKRIAYIIAALVAVFGFVTPSVPAKAASDERRIVYMNGMDGHVISIKPDGSGRLDYGPDFYPALSPDGTKIAFARDTSDYTARDLMVSDIDGNNLHKVADHVYTPGSKAQFFSWSPDGAKLAFTVESGFFDPHTGSAYKQIATADVNGNDPMQLTRDDANVANINPVWSPDGTKILYSHNTDLYIMNADGTNQHLIVAGATEGTWAPDSSKILFLEVGVGVRTANLDGSGRVTLSAIGNNARWSPGGSSIVMEAPECGCSTQSASIISIKPDGTGKTVLAAPPSAGSVQHPVWSPDGTKVAFVEFASWEPTRLVTVPATGGTANVVIIESAGYPEWAYLAYTPATPTPTPDPTPTPPPVPEPSKHHGTIHFRAIINGVQTQLHIQVQGNVWQLLARLFQ